MRRQDETGNASQPLPSRARRWLGHSAFPRSLGSALPLLLACAAGAAAGISGYTFSYAKGLSYFGTEPRACTNCHIMQPEYAGWQKASHHAAATCVDCHLPAAFLAKYWTKAENGYRHGKLFTTQTFEEPISIQPRGLEILQANCERCHAALIRDVHAVAVHAPVPPGAAWDGRVPCIHCHWMVGHGERAGLGGPWRASELGAELETSEAHGGRGEPR